MNKIQDTKENFLNGKIDKKQFIREMHVYHEMLNYFAVALSSTEIHSIEIHDQSVTFISRPVGCNPGLIRFAVDICDPHSSPLNAFNFNKYEANDAPLLYSLIKGSEVVFDIGANVGWYAMHFARINPLSTVHAFEPVPDIFRQFEANVIENQIQNVVMNNVALSDSIGDVSLFYSRNITGASSMKNITEDKSMNSVACKSIKLDDYVIQARLSKLDIIKCDVEGAELQVFRGAEKSLEKFRPIVFTEMLRKWSRKFEYHPNDVIAMLGAIGYDCFVSRFGSLHRIMEVDEETVETNFFFLHRKKHANEIVKFSS